MKNLRKFITIGLVGGLVGLLGGYYLGKNNYKPTQVYLKYLNNDKLIDAMVYSKKDKTLFYGQSEDNAELKIEYSSSNYDK